MMWDRREFLSAASKALKLAVAVAAVPSLAQPIAEAALAPTPKNARPYNIQAKLYFDPHYRHWMSHWSFQYRGKDYDCAIMWDDSRMTKRQMIRKSAELVEVAMRKKNCTS